jgi:glycosyltransferase involved in cell wall biosynthesis
MKILHVLYSGLGGHGNVFFSMVKGDVNKEMEYEALFYGIEHVREEYIEQCKKNKIKFFVAKKKEGIDIRYYNTILQSIKISNPDIVFLHGSAYIFPAKIAGYLSKKKHTIIVRETQANHLKTTVQWLTLSIAMQMANKIVCLTPEFNEQIKEKIKWLYRKKKVTVIPNGIDLSVYQPCEKTPDDSKIIIGMQSRIIHIKDHATLIKAFAAVKKNSNNKGKKLRLKIAGDGELKSDLIILSKQLDIEKDVIFTGMLNEPELTVFLNSLDIYIHASFGETMSTAIMQAMACGLPVIASDVKGINNMITNLLNGIFIPVKNELLMAQAIDRLIKDRLFRKTLGQNARIYAMDNFSNQTMFYNYKTQLFVHNT